MFPTLEISKSFFPRRILDIGCGAGDFLIASAKKNPAVEHIGIDFVKQMIQQTSSRPELAGLPNIRFIADDAVSWLRDRCDENSFDEIHIYHPQPYLDPTEVHFGMLSDSFLKRVWEVLRTGGFMVLQTDNKAYGKYLLEAAKIYFHLKIQEGPWPDAPQGRTKRESVAIKKKLHILRVIARPRAEPLDTPPPSPYFERPSVRKRRSPRRKL